MSGSRRRSAALLTALAVGCGVAACGSDAVSGSVGASPREGTFTLRTINGNALPAVYQATPAVTTLLADTLRLGARGGYTEIVLSTTADPGQAPTKTDTLRLSGTWVDGGTTVTIGSRGGTFAGTDTLTVVAGGNQGLGGSASTEVYVRVP